MADATPMREMKIITYRCSEELRERITRAARKRKLSQQKFMDLIVSDYLARSEGPSK